MYYMETLPLSTGWPVPLAISSVHLVLAATILEEGTTVHRRLSGFGRVELVNWKYFNRDITIDNSTSIDATLHYAAPTLLCHARLRMPCPRSLRRKLSLLVENPRNSRKFLPRKFPAYTVFIQNLITPKYCKSLYVCFFFFGWTYGIPGRFTKN